MFCRKCGKEYEGKFCPNCGEPAESPVVPPQPVSNFNEAPLNASQIPPIKMPFYSKTWFVVIMLVFCCFPLGIFLMWKYKKFNKTARIIITGFFVVCFIVGIASPKTTTNVKEPATTYEATSEEETVGETVSTVSQETTVADNREAASVADKEVTDIIVAAESDYNKLVELISSGHASDLSLYDAAKAVKSNLGTYSVNVGRVKCDGIRDYTNAATSYIINMQLVASDVMKYVDKQNIKDLSSAKEEISNNENYIFVTLSARMEFLENSGFTDEEIMNILGASDSEDAAK